MTGTELLSAYPTCRTAVAYVEFILCQPPDGEDESAWEMLMRVVPPLTPDEVVTGIRSSLKEDLLDQSVTPPCPAEFAVALKEREESAFRHYIRGKMGAM